jgi:hypothetical protein
MKGGLSTILSEKWPRRLVEFSANERNNVTVMSCYLTDTKESSVPVLNLANIKDVRREPRHLRRERFSQGAAPSFTGHAQKPTQTFMNPSA